MLLALVALVFAGGNLKLNPKLDYTSDSNISAEVVSDLLGAPDSTLRVS
jgi:hypothetical protein